VKLGIVSDEVCSATLTVDLDTAAEFSYQWQAHSSTNGE